MLEPGQEVRFPIEAGHHLVLPQPIPGDGYLRVEPQRGRNCNQDMALGCHKLIVGHPNREESPSDGAPPAEAG